MLPAEIERRQNSHAGARPGAARQAHVVGLDVERRVPERVASEEPVEVGVDEHPVEHRVERDHDRGVALGRHQLDPVLELAHRIRRRQALRGQRLHRQPADRERGLDHVVGRRFQFDVEAALRVVDQARADREHRVVGRGRPGRLDVDADVGLGTFDARRSRAGSLGTRTRLPVSRGRWGPAARDDRGSRSRASSSRSPRPARPEARARAAGTGAAGRASSPRRPGTRTCRRRSARASAAPRPAGRRRRRGTATRRRRARRAPSKYPSTLSSATSNSAVTGIGCGHESQPAARRRQRGLVGDHQQPSESVGASREPRGPPMPSSAPTAARAAQADAGPSSPCSTKSRSRVVPPSASTCTPSGV